VPEPDAGVPFLQAESDVLVYRTPGKEYEPYGQLSRGNTAELMGVSPDNSWWAIRLPSADSGLGWVQTREVSIQNATEDIPIIDQVGSDQNQISGSGTSFVIANERLDIYDGPGTEFGIIGLMEEGQTNELIGRSSNGLWWVIRASFAEDGRGWVLADYVSSENDENIPVIEYETDQIDGELGVQLVPEITALTNVNVRSGPGIDYLQVDVMRTGETARVSGISFDGLWWFVQGSGEGEKEGWVSTQYVDAKNVENVPIVRPQSPDQPFEIPSPPEGSANIVSNSVLNIRDGPGTEYEIIGKLEVGQTAELTGTSPDLLWFAINFPSGRDGRGWVSAKFVSANGVEDVPVIR
jgi:uncharacterized protein YraI